jgi:predicted Fe-S protein YdhL (DUF1289 family)
MSSPCVGHCQLNADGEFCMGCKRTIHEIIDWSQLSDAEQQAVWDRLFNLQPDQEK